METSDSAAIVEFGEKYLEESTGLYPEQVDAALLAHIAIARADQSLDLPRAIAYAQQAYNATATFEPWKTPGNTDESWMEHSAKDYRENRYPGTRALALEAQGWALCQTGQCTAGEPVLRQAVELRRGEKNLLHLAAALEKLGRASEAAEIKTRAQNEWVESLKRRMGTTPSKDFEATTLDGRAVRLSDLKGKVVLVNFWATWCGPCVQEMPTLVDVYQKYRDRGLEILAISVDEEAARYKVGRFVKEHELNFPVLYDNGIAELYNVASYPTSLLIDREGTVRLRINLAEKRSLDALLAELLK
jgi:thiol-disulfide isomerase/thioredoxin